MRWFENLNYEIMKTIFKHVKSPLNLTLTCKNWSVIAKKPDVKAEWLLSHYGKARALKQAVEFGPSFIDKSLCEALVERKSTISRPFIQDLLKNFGKYDQRLIELRRENNVGQLDIDHTKINSTWSNLPADVFIYLLNKGPSKDRDNNDNDKKLSAPDTLDQFFVNGPSIICSSEAMIDQLLNGFSSFN